MSLERELGTIQEKLDNLLILQERQNGRVDKLDEEVDSLKSWSAYYKGAFAVIAGIFWAVWEKL